MTRGRLTVLRLDNYLGFVDEKKRKRLPNLYPNKQVQKKVRATAYEQGYTYAVFGDLQTDPKIKNMVSYAQYRKLQKQYPKRGL